MALSADPENIKALSIDLDNTILGPGAVLSERMIALVNKCMRRGLKIFINTGRSIEGAEPFRSSLGVSGPVICCNGAVVADLPEGIILRRTLMDKKAAKFCFDLSRKKGLYCQVYFLIDDTRARMKLITELDDPGRDMYYRQTGLLAELMDLDEALAEYAQEGCVKTMFIAEPEILETLRPELEQVLGSSVYITRTQKHYLELMNAKVSKGNGLAFVMERFSLKREEVIAFGDDENDVPMSDAAGYFIVPSNAKDSVKSRADLVTASNAEDGVAAFLEEFFRL